MIVVKVDEDVWETLHLMKIRGRKKSLNEIVKDLIICHKKQPE